MRKIYPVVIYRSFILFTLAFFICVFQLQAQIDISIGTGTTGNGNTEYPAPMQDFYEGSRMQYLYRASELSAAGMSSGTINAIKFNVTALGTSTNSYFEIEQLTIKIGSTTTASLSATAWEPVSTTVYGPFNYLPVLGINTFAFTTAFFWNGTDNIVVEICGGSPVSTTDVFWTGNSSVPWTTGLSFNGSHSYRADNLDNLCGTTTTTNTGTMTTRPNITFNWTSSGPCTSPPTPGTAVASPASVCGGVPVNLTLSGISYGSGQTYQWQSATSLAGPYTNFGPSSNTPFYTISAPTVTTFYRAVVTCSGNSQTSVPVELVVNASTPVPTISASPTGNVCSGTSVSLTTPACTGCTYTWSTGASTNSISVSSAGLYSVTVANACGSGAISQEVSVDPSPSLSISSPTSVCLGSSVNISANGAQTYTWSPAAGLSATTGANVTAMPTTTTTYTVTGTIGTCTKTMSVTITVNPIPSTPTLSVTTGSATFCVGGSVTLSSSTAAGYQWYRDGNAISGATNQTFVASLAGSYTVRAVASNCSSAPSTAQAVTVNPIPPQPTITQVGNALQSSASSGNQWLLNGSAITGATGATYTPTTSGLYTVQVTTSGCTGVASAAFNFTITATNDPVLDRKITVAPNPVRDDLVIRYSGTGARFNVMLVSMNGAVLRRGNFSTNYLLDMRKYSAGLYVVRIVNERTGEKVQRLIVKQ